MTHKVTIPIPPGGNRMAGGSDITGYVEYTPPHDLTPEQERRNIEKIERQTERFYAKLQERLAEPGE